MEDFVEDFTDALHSGNLKDLYLDKKYSCRDIKNDVTTAMFDNGKTPLIYAIEWFQNGTSIKRREESVAMINTLYNSFHQGIICTSHFPQTADNEGNTPLMHAAEVLHIAAIKKILMPYWSKNVTATDRNGETFLMKLLKAATDAQIENNTRQAIEQIVIELLTVDTSHNRKQKSPLLSETQHAPSECISPAELLQASDQNNRGVFDYLMQFGSTKCISALFGKHQLRQIYFDKWITKCISERKYSVIEPTLDGIYGIGSEEEKQELLDKIKFPISLRVSLIEAYVKEEDFNVDIKKLMIYLFKLSDFRRVDPSSGQSILHTLAAFITPDSKCHRDHLGDDLIAHVLLIHDNAIDINAQDGNGYTVLMYAVNNRFSIRTLRNIIESTDIDMTVENNDGQIVIDMLDSSLSAEARSVVEKAYNKQVFSKQNAFMQGSIDNNKALNYNQKRFFHQSLTYLECDYDLKLGEGMSDLHRRKLIGKRVYLCEELTVDNNILNHLLQYRVINDDMQEELTQIATRRNKVEKLLSIIPRRGPKAYDNFIKTLNNTGNKFIAEELNHFVPDTHDIVDVLPVADIYGFLLKFIRGLIILYFIKRTIHFFLSEFYDF